MWPVTFLVMAWRRIQHQTGELFLLRAPEIVGMKLEITRLSTVLPTVGHGQRDLRTRLHLPRNQVRSDELLSDVTSHAKQLPGNPFGNLQSSAPEGIPLNLATLGGEGSHPGSESQEVTLTGEVTLLSRSVADQDQLIRLNIEDGLIFVKREFGYLQSNVSWPWKHIARRPRSR